MYQPTTRLLTVLELLQSRPLLSGAELARRLEVDGRTVRRYVTMLQDMGIPVEAAHGRYGGYHLRPGYKLPPLMFTEDEALAVTLGLLAARHLGLTATAPAVEGALAKVERVLPTALGERIRGLEATIGFSHPARSFPPAAPSVLLLLSSAAELQRRVWLRYKAADGAESERVMDPYGLVFHQGRWYVVGHDHASGEVRIFRVDRIQEVEARGERFERPAGFDPVEHLIHALADIPWGYELEVLLEATLSQAKSMVPAHLGSLEETNGGVLLRTQVDDLARAAGWFAGLGCPFVVVRPDELRHEVRQLAATLTEMAKRSVATR